MTLGIIRGFTMVANDDTNLVLEMAELKTPSLEEIGETFQPGGSDLEVEILGLGTKALVAQFKLKSTNPTIIGLFGRAPGIRDKFTGKRFVVDEEDGAQHEHVIDMVGRLAKVDQENAQGGKASGYDHEVKGIWEYTEYWDSRPMHRFNLKLGGWVVRNFQSVDSRRRQFLFG